MKQVYWMLSLSVLIGVVGVGRAAHAQPTIPREEIPSDLSVEVREEYETLYSSDPQQRAVAVMHLEPPFGVRPEGPEISFLMAMLHDDAVVCDEEELQRRRMLSSYIGLFGLGSDIPNSPGQQAASALGRSAARWGTPTSDELLALLANDKPAVRANAARALGAMAREINIETGPKGFQVPLVSEALLGLLHDEQPQVRLDAVKALGEIVDMGPSGHKKASPAVLAAFVDALEDDHTEVRKCAAIMLRVLAEPSTVEPLIEVVRSDESPEVRQTAARALQEIGDPRAVDVLIEVLEDPQQDVDVRREVAEALGKTGDDRAIEPLITALNDPDWQVRIGALAVTDVLRDYHVLRPLLIDRLQDEDWQVRDIAARRVMKLGELKDPEAFSVLATALSDGQPNVRASVVTSLGMLKDRRAVPLLIGALQRDDNSYVRWHAARALGELGDARAVGPLQAIEADENEDEIVRSQARTALEKFNNAVRSGQL